MILPGEKGRMPAFFLLCFVITTSSFSQTFQFKDYNVDQGLNDRFVYTINQDNKGFIWVGTGSGVSKFDGFNFFNVSIPDSGSKIFPVSSLGLNDGNIVFGFSNGKVYRSKGNELASIEGVDAFRINNIVQGKESELYILTQSKGVFRYDAGKDEKAQKLHSSEDFIIYSGTMLNNESLMLGTQNGVVIAGINNDILTRVGEVNELMYLKVQAIIPVPGAVDNFLVGTEDDGIYRLRIADDTIMCSRLLDDEKLNQLRVQDMVFDDSGNLWVPTFGKGVIKIIFRDNEALQYISFTKDEGLPGNDSKTVFQDREGNIWIGHFGNGLSLMASDAYSLIAPGDGENTNNIIYLEEVGGLVFAGTDRGYYLYDIQTGSTISYTDLSSVSATSRITSFCHLPGDLLLFGTDNNGIFRSTKGEAPRRYFISENNLENFISDIKYDGSYLWIATRGGVLLRNILSGETKRFTTYENLPHNSINQVFPVKEGMAYIATQGNRLYSVDSERGVNAGKAVVYGGGRTEFQCYDIDSEGMVWGATLGKGIYGFGGDTLINISIDEGLLSRYCYSIMADSRNNIWVGHEQGFSVYDRKIGQVRTFIDIFDSGDDFNENSILETSDGEILMGTTGGFMKYDPAVDQARLVPPLSNILSVEIDKVVYPFSESYNLPYKKRYDINIKMAGLFYSDPGKVYYRYKLDNYDTGWSDPEFERTINYKLSDGDYRFNLVSYNYDGITDNNIIGFNISIRKPFWRMWWFVAIIIFIALLIIIVIVRLRERAQERVNRYLESELDDRTREVVKQKEEIEQKNREITDSINYAQRIQAGLLPSVNKLKEVFDGSFVFYRPRDIVSGDFYWFDYIADDRFILVCADSTGHGVPGAFMSMIGSALIQEIVHRKEITRPSEILYTLDREISTTLNQGSNGEHSTSDGMDIIVCEYNIKTQLLRFASAMRPVIILMDGEQYYIRGNKSSVGGESVLEKVFDDQEYYLKKGDAVYMFSDGYPDQFGGPLGKKLKIIRMKELVEEIKGLPVNSQSERVSTYFEHWKGDFEQVDDVLFMGVIV